MNDGWRDAAADDRWFDLLDQLVAGLARESGNNGVVVEAVNPRPRWLLAVLRGCEDRKLFAKVALPNEEGSLTVDRPRLVPTTSNDERLASEASAATRLADNLPSGDPDLSAVSVVHWQPDPAMLVVEWVEGEPLSRLLSPVEVGRRPRSRADLIRGAGRWLSYFHSLSVAEPPAYDYPDDVLKWLEDVYGYLGTASHEERWRSLITEVARAVERNRHRSPMPGLHHGDMAARNLMTRPDGRIVGIDAGAVWQAPRAHDLAVFVTDIYLRSPYPTARSRAAREFFRAYGYPVDETWAARLFVAVAAIDRYIAWKGRVAIHEGTSPRLLVEGTRLGLMASLLTKHGFE